MNESEANRLSTCGYGCHIIGGPWISTNPRCPKCNGNDSLTLEDFVQEIIQEASSFYHDKHRQLGYDAIHSKESLMEEFKDYYLS